MVRMRPPVEPQPVQHFPPEAGRPSGHARIGSGGHSLRNPPSELQMNIKFWVDCLLELIAQSRKCEAARMDLACRKDFNLIDAFALLDLDGNGCVSKDQLYSRLRAFAPEKEMTATDVDLVFKRYNKSEDGRLKFSEFMHFVSPMHEEYAEMVHARKPNKLYDKPRHAFQVFDSGETFNGYIYVLWQVIENERKAEEIRQRMA